MKRNTRKTVKHTRRSAAMLIVALAMVGAFGLGGIFANVAPKSWASAESASPSPVIDTSPAIYVAEKNANSVVGIITNSQGWDQYYGVQDLTVSQGSGVVIAEGGYVLTNNHVIENGDAYQVLLPDGEKVDATLVGADSNMDLAVLKVSEKAETLTPVTVGSSENLKVGSTVIAIGNPGGEILANTVTQGIISALERSSMSSSNTTRNVDYIQHDAPINSGNSGGGLFDYMGNLIGINTLKYRGNVLSSSSYEGLGFAIPIDTAYPLAQQLIQYGKVIRPQLGITVADQTGPDEAMNDYPPASVRVNTINAGSPAEKAGMQQNDFIIALNGERITSRRELTTLLDKFQPGDTVTVTVVRYQNVTEARNNDYGNYYGYGNFPFPFGFGNYGYGNYGSNGYGSNGYGSNGYGSNGYTYTYGDGTLQVSGGYTTIDLQVTLEAQK